MNDHPLGQDVCIKSNPPLKKGSCSMWTRDVLITVFLLDQFGFIERSLTHTQIEDEDDAWSTDIAKWRICLTWCSCLVTQRSLADNQGQNKWSTDVEKWRKFSRTYANDTQRVSLLVSSGTSHISTAGC